MPLLGRAYSTLLLLSLLSWAGCGDVRPIWKGTVSLEGYTMYFSEPCEYQVDLTRYSDTLAADLELVITYYVGTTRQDLPLFIVLENSRHDLQEYAIHIPLKENGQWLGQPEENEIDYYLTHLAVSDLRLAPDTYTMRIYANDDKTEKVYGVVSITARLFARGERAN
ncbi:MAG: hypothetical protein D6722_14910 [Bacteroidetes bacterium]|nr:MAG: hypothetical protein D6722_14910 [Bacteroidota bacterium]